jgi:tetratricopeptide (TPR) repeat protein
MVQAVTDKAAVPPTIWNLQQRRNVNFVGREQLLQDIEKGFSHGARRPLVLIGPGGSGKTALAIEYAYRHQADYEICWWIRADTQAMTATDLAALAPKLAGPVQIHDAPRQSCNAVLRELQQRDRWLLIFDAARQPSDLAPFLPAKAEGHILITSVNNNWEPLGKRIPVKPWMRPESVEFLKRRLGEIGDLHNADQLAAALGDLPLALEQAAACIDQAGISIGEYIIDFEAYWAEILGQNRPAGQYPTSAAMAWELSFRRIEMINPLAAQLLTLCGFFAPDGIPLDMIHNSTAELNPKLRKGLRDKEGLREAMEILERFSLARASEKTISIHGVIGAMAQDRLVDIDRMSWASAAVRIVSSAFPFDSQNPNSWPACAEVLPHVLAAAMHAQNAGMATTVVVDLMSRAGRFLLKHGNYSEANNVLEMAQALVKSTYGEQSVQAADIANNLARVRHRLGDLTGASGLYELALQIDRSIYGDNDVHLATIANNSAMTLVELGKLDEARERFEWAIDVYRKTYEKDHPKIASVMNNLGFALIQLNDAAGARQWLEQALTITETTLGVGHPQTACITANLGSALRAAGELQKAREMFERALLIDETAFGPHHPAVARDLLGMAQLLSDQGEFDESVRLLERVLIITESSYGPQHRETALCLSELTRALKGNGDVERAVDCMMRAASLMRKSPRRTHETVIGDEGMLG